MSKKQTPTFSQISYIVTGILAAHVQHGDELTNEVIQKAVSAAKTASEAIEDIINETTDGSAEDATDVFKEYPWTDKPERYTNLANWLKDQGVTSNRRISEIFHEQIEAGYLKKDALSGKYIHSAIPTA
jgi:hypothetical protein